MANFDNSRSAVGKLIIQNFTQKSKPPGPACKILFAMIEIVMMTKAKMKGFVLGKKMCFFTRVEYFAMVNMHRAKWHKPMGFCDFAQALPQGNAEKRK